MAIKKNELYSSLWASCDKLRGGMDASQYKDYILTLLFVKYVTDKFKGVKYADTLNVYTHASYAHAAEQMAKISQFRQSPESQKDREVAVG